LRFSQALQRSVSGQSSVAQLPEFRAVVHLLEMRDLVRDEIVDDGGGAIMMRQEKDRLPSAVQEPQRLDVSLKRIALALRPTVGVFRDQRFDVALGLALQEIGDGGRQVAAVAMDEAARPLPPSVDTTRCRACPARGRSGAARRAAAP
jgi:hypothetical protein